MSKEFNDLPENIDLPDFYDLTNEVRRLGNQKIAAVIISCLEDHKVSFSDFLLGLSSYSFEIGCEEASGHLDRAAGSLEKKTKSALAQNLRKPNH